MIFSTIMNSPLGFLKIFSDEDKITEIRFLKNKEKNSTNEIPKCLEKCVNQLKEYFSNKRRRFDLPLDLNGTDFQIKVWNELKKIPYGKTATYKDIAERIGNSNASRAVGNANNKNNFPIVIPCHRVINSNGKIGGYAGGSDLKLKLLRFEKSVEI